MPSPQSPFLRDLANAKFAIVGGFDLWHKRKRDIDDLKSAAERGDKRALELLFRTAFHSTMALNSLRPPSLLKPRARKAPVWPVISSDGPAVVKLNRAFFRLIELGCDVESFDPRVLLSNPTVGRKWAVRLLALIVEFRRDRRKQIRLGEEVPHTLKLHDGSIVPLPEDILIASANLPELSSGTVQQWRKVVKRLLEIYTGNRYHENSELRRLVQASSISRAKKRFFIPGSKEETNLIRGDILKKIYEGINVAAKGFRSKGS